MKVKDGALVYIICPACLEDSGICHIAPYSYEAVLRVDIICPHCEALYAWKGQWKFTGETMVINKIGEERAQP